MARFKNAVLGVMERIYGFASDVRSISQLQIEQPIQPVHDVSREAELGSVDSFPGQMGTWVSIIEKAVPGANPYHESVDPWGILSGGAFGWAVPPIEWHRYMIWLLDISMWTDAGDGAQMTEGGVALVQPIGPSRWRFQGSTYDWFRPVFYTDGTATNIYRAGGAAYRDNFINQMTPNLPAIVPPYCEIVMSFTAGGAMSGPGVMTQALLWIGKRGIWPPGLR